MNIIPNLWYKFVFKNPSFHILNNTTENRHDSDNKAKIL